MVTVATGIAYTGLLRTFIINITTPVWFTTTTSDVGQVLVPLLPPSLFPMDADLVRTLYNGMPGGRDLAWWQVLVRIPWSAWLLPMAWWGLFMILVVMAMLGLVGIFSHQWIENEKMNFPLLRVPQILAETAEQGKLGHFLTNKYFHDGTLPSRCCFIPSTACTLISRRYRKSPTCCCCVPTCPGRGCFPASSS